MTGERIVAYGAISKQIGKSPVTVGPGSDLTPEMVDTLDKHRTSYPESVVVMLGHDGETSLVYIGDGGGTLVSMGSPKETAVMLRNIAAMCDLMDKIHTGEVNVNDVVKSVALTNALAAVIGADGLERLAARINEATAKK